MFAYKLINNNFDFPHILNKTNFKIYNRNTRNRELFLINNVLTNYLLPTPVNTLMAVGNYNTNLDLFFCDTRDIKTTFNVLRLAIYN